MAAFRAEKESTYPFPEMSSFSCYPQKQEESFKTF